MFNGLPHFPIDRTRSTENYDFITTALSMTFGLKVFTSFRTDKDTYELNTSV